MQMHDLGMEKYLFFRIYFFIYCLIFFLAGLLQIKVINLIFMIWSAGRPIPIAKYDDSVLRDMSEPRLCISCQSGHAGHPWPELIDEPVAVPEAWFRRWHRKGKAVVAEDEIYCRGSFACEPRRAGEDVVGAVCVGMGTFQPPICAFSDLVTSCI